MSDINHLVEMLGSRNPNTRYEACEELRVSPQPLPPEAINALKTALDDPNPDVADAAQRAVMLHAPPPPTDTDRKQSNLEESMGGKPVQDTDWPAIACFILGILHVVLFFGVANYIPFFALGVTPIFGGLGLIAFFLPGKNQGSRWWDWCLTSLGLVSGSGCSGIFSFSAETSRS